MSTANVKKLILLPAAEWERLAREHEIPALTSGEVQSLYLPLKLKKEKDFEEQNQRKKQHSLPPKPVPMDPFFSPPSPSPSPEITTTPPRPPSPRSAPASSTLTSSDSIKQSSGSSLPHPLSPPPSFTGKKSGDKSFPINNNTNINRPTTSTFLHKNKVKKSPITSSPHSNTHAGMGVTGGNGAPSAQKKIAALSPPSRPLRRGVGGRFVSNAASTKKAGGRVESSSSKGSSVSDKIENVGNLKMSQDHQQKRSSERLAALKKDDANQQAKRFPFSATMYSPTGKALSNMIQRRNPENIFSQRTKAAKKLRQQQRREQQQMKRRTSQAITQKYNKIRSTNQQRGKKKKHSTTPTSIPPIQSNSRKMPQPTLSAQKGKKREFIANMEGLRRQNKRNKKQRSSQSPSLPSETRWRSNRQSAQKANNNRLALLKERKL